MPITSELGPTNLKLGNRAFRNQEWPSGYGIEPGSWKRGQCLRGAMCEVCDGVNVLGLTFAMIKGRKQIRN